MLLYVSNIPFVRIRYINQIFNDKSNYIIEYIILPLGAAAFSTFFTVLNIIFFVHSINIFDTISFWYDSWNY